jgi:hypothetical protein
VFPDLAFEIEVAWADSTRRLPAFVRARDASRAWSTPLGVRVATTLEELERLRGTPIEFMGFGWDYGGASWWEEQNGGLALAREIDPAAGPSLLDVAVREPRRVREIEGERVVRSDHPLVRELAIVVRELRVDWDRPLPPAPPRDGRADVGVGSSSTTT